MRKILPVNLEVDIQISCFDFYRLSVILAHDKYLPWYVERFIEMHMNEYFDCYYYDVRSDFLFLYDELLEFRDIGKESDIIEQIKASINNYEFLILRINRALTRTEKTDDVQLHGELVVGYDDDEQLIFVLKHNGIQWMIDSVSFSQFASAFESSIHLIRNGAMDVEGPGSLKEHFNLNEPASAFRIHNIGFNRQPRLNVIFNSFQNFLNGGEKRNGIGLSGSVRYGTSIYRGYYDDLYNYLLDNPNPHYNGTPMEFRIFLGIRRLHENKRVLLTKLEYLKLQRLIHIDESIISRLSTLSQEIDVSGMLLQRYFLTKNRTDLSTFAGKLREAERLDFSILTELCNLIYDTMRASI